eukprot:scaffold97661_cov19-Tisochrysis_lutea.AAC.1
MSFKPTCCQVYPFILCNCLTASAGGGRAHARPTTPATAPAHHPTTQGGGTTAEGAGVAAAAGAIMYLCFIL